jgi:predicted nucleic acid-binding protein
MIRAGQPQVIDFDLQAAVVLGKMWSTRSLNNFIANDPRSSKVKNGADLVIAAIAIARGMTIVSADTSDFLQIDAVFPLPGLFDPFEHKWIVGP